MARVAGILSWHLEQETYNSDILAFLLRFNVDTEAVIEPLLMMKAVSKKWHTAVPLVVVHEECLAPFDGSASQQICRRAKVTMGLHETMSFFSQSRAAELNRNQHSVADVSVEIGGLAGCDTMKQTDKKRPSCMYLTRNGTFRSISGTPSIQTAMEKMTARSP